MRNSIIALISLLLLSCSTAKKATDSSSLLADLISDEWVLESLKGQEVNEADFMKGLPSLNFQEDGALQGSTGCNSFSGNFALGEVLKINPGAMSKMNCPGSGESDFLSALKSSTSLDIIDNELVLKNATDELLQFTSSKE